MQKSGRNDKHIIVLKFRNTFVEIDFYLASWTQFMLTVSNVIL